RALSAPTWPTCQQPGVTTSAASEAILSRRPYASPTVGILDGDLHGAGRSPRRSRRFGLVPWACSRCRKSNDSEHDLPRVPSGRETGSPVVRKGIAKPMCSRTSRPSLLTFVLIGG